MPYWRLSLFYGFYFAALGGFIAYLFLKANEVSDLNIGALLSVFVGTRICLPLVLAWAVDKTQKPVLALKISSSLMLISFIGLIFADGLPSMLF